MDLRASDVALSPRERVEILRPGDLRLRYEAIARGVGVFLLLPGAMVILMILFLMPVWFGAAAIALACSFLHLGLLLTLLALIRAMERPLVAIMWRAVWPVHRWWLAHHHPERLEVVVHRDVHLVHEPSRVQLDEASGQLVAGQHKVDLSKPFELSLERCELPQRRLRVRLANLGGGRGVVLCTDLPRHLCRSWCGIVELLPRSESDATWLEWTDFWRLVGAVRPFGRATGATWPAQLTQMVG